MPTNESIEVERKYAAPARTGVPPLQEAAGVARAERRRTVRLDAQYFDTEDLDLAAHRITLRRRTGGGDAGWHLKLPASKESRREIQMPLSPAADGVPAELLDYVRAIVRDRPLVPAVRLQTRRTRHELFNAAGILLAELADDRVSATSELDGVEPQEWREWEVELQEGGPQIFEAVEPMLREAGAEADAGPSKLARALGDRRPSASAPDELPGHPDVEDLVSAYLRQETDRLKSHDYGVRVHEHDAIHQMRVAARRLRTVLSTYRSLLAEGRSDELRTELKALADALGTARDSEVMRDRLADLIERQPDDLVWGPVAERVADELTRRYESGHENALAFLSSQRYFRLLDALDALPGELVETDLSHADAAEHITDLIARDWRRLRRTVRAADAAPDEEREVLLHEVRKAAKRLRYATESASAVLGKQGKQLAKAASAITDILGDHNDSMITQGVIAELAAQAQERGESTFTYGRIQGWEAARADISNEAYLDALRDVDALRYPGWKRARPKQA
ncbi:CHAD domain-containing protein [Epidermidibacterium keratini]|uniref:CHAD domain-containing protein n=1 Tax=Epidermidibacterium keratini TaxID=1891644 RepID=A0A7L4YL95_9ACTN|nr:CYTH and CHAD domain-containing protein [Epidermidibacterium keratini]QHC00055.1 CHAD domain-containing protein [Epidermidibacterium keratini]